MHHVDFALLVLRASLGLMLMAHGTNKIKGGIDNACRWFASMGLRPGWFHGRLAAASELVGGAMLVLGRLTPGAAAIVIGVMRVAGGTPHRQKGVSTFRPRR